MNWLKNVFGNEKKGDAEKKVDDLLREQTGDPAYPLRLEWITAYGKKDFKKALDKVNNALNIVPNAPDYLALRAMTYYSLKNYARAASDIKAALQGNPTQKEALGIRDAMKADAAQYRDKAREFARKNDKRPILDLLNTAAELEPDNPTTFVFRGLQYVEAGNFEAGIKDVTHALELDPKYPDGQKILQAVKDAAKEKKGGAEQFFFFICSGNASLVEAYHNMFKQAAAADSGKNMILQSPAHYYARKETLSARAEEARKLSLAFDGQSYMGSKATPLAKMENVLQSLRAASFGELHIASILVSQAGVAWVQKVYQELLKQAAAQGILPYEMYVTKDQDAARFLLDSFEKIS